MGLGFDTRRVGRACHVQVIITLGCPWTWQVHRQDDVQDYVSRVGKCVWETHATPVRQNHLGMLCAQLLAGCQPNPRLEYINEKGIHGTLLTFPVARRHSHHL